MPPFKYPKLIHQDQIRILELQRGSDEEPLRGVIRTTRIPASHPLDVPHVVTHNLDGSLPPIWQCKWENRIWKWDFPIVQEDGQSSTTTWVLQHPLTGKTKTVTAAPKLSTTFVCKRTEYASKKAYDALSYTWGNLAKTHEIKIGDASLPITTNLYTALRELRRNHTLSLWVDAVCIDQSDLQERNHQVRMMRRIFSGASSVIVWLGDSPSNETTVEKLLLDYNRNAYRSVKGEVPSILDYPSKLLIGLRKLFSRPWWTRVWIIQEVVSAKEIVVHHGNRTFPWSFLRNIGDAIQRNEFRSHPNAQILRSSGARNFFVLDSFRKHRSMMLIRLLQCTQHYNASDPRDKLYALLGMASDVSPDDLAPDYDQPVEQIFWNLVRFMIHTRRSLDIITSSRLALAPPGLPTWLPDWRISDSLLPLHGEEVAGHLFCACGTTAATAAMIGAPGERPTLQAQGIIVDKVDFLGGPCKVSQECLPTLRRWQYIAEQNLDQSVVNTLFPWTIIAGKDNKGRKATMRFVQAYNSFIGGTTGAPSEPVQLYADAVTRAATGRRFFITKRGRMGLGPADLQLGDRIVVFDGCSIPLVVRASGDGVSAVLIGEAYTSGIMEGEVMNMVAEGVCKKRMISLK